MAGQRIPMSPGKGVVLVQMNVVTGRRLGIVHQYSGGHRLGDEKEFRQAV